MSAPRSSPRRRIALLIESDGPGGAETVVVHLARELLAEGHTVLPVTLAGGQGWLGARLQAIGLNVTLPRLRGPLDPRFALTLARWARSQRVDVLHTHEFTMGFYAGVAGLLAGIPHVITMHGGVGFAAAARRRYALAWSARRASAVVGVSSSTCVHLADALRLAPNTIHLVRNGVVRPTGEREQTREQLGVAHDTPLLLAVGNLYPVKGHDVLIDACALLAQRMPAPWQLVIAGRGQEEPALRERLERGGLSDRVRLLGLRDDVPDLLAACDAWVLPSRSEGLPMALLEAMLAERPVVCTAVGGIPDALEHGTLGLLVPPEDPAALAVALEQVLASPMESRARAGRARAVAEAEYTAAVMTARYVELYEAALTRRA